MSSPTRSLPPSLPLPPILSGMCARGQLQRDTVRTDVGPRDCPYSTPLSQAFQHLAPVSTAASRSPPTTRRLAGAREMPTPRGRSGATPRTVCIPSTLVHALPCSHRNAADGRVVTPPPHVRYAVPYSLSMPSLEAAATSEAARPKQTPLTAAAWSEKETSSPQFFVSKTLTLAPPTTRYWPL